MPSNPVCIWALCRPPQLDLSPWPAATSALCTGTGRKGWSDFGLVLLAAFWFLGLSSLRKQIITQLPPIVETSPPGQASPGLAAPREKLPSAPSSGSASLSLQQLPPQILLRCQIPHGVTARWYFLGSSWEPADKFRRELWSHGMQSPGSAGQTEPGVGPGVPSQVRLVSLAAQPG